MKRYVALLLAFVMVLATLTGCGGKDTDKESGKDGDTSVEVNTDVKGSITVGINSYRNSDFEAICEAFKKQYPNV